MKMNRFATVVLAAGMLAAPALVLAQGPPPPQGYGQGGYGPGGQGGGYGPGGQGGWDAPPSEFTRDIQRNAFHDGLEGGRKDFENHRAINVRNRDEYRNYHGPERRVYRQAFERGYMAFWNHNRGGGPGNGFGPRPY